MASIYCGNNKLERSLINKSRRLGTRYKCLQKGIGLGKNQPVDLSYTHIYEPIDRTKVYCGTRKSLPRGYNRMGNLPECLRRGVGIGKKIKADSLGKKRRSPSKKKKRSRSKKKKRSRSKKKKRSPPKKSRKKSAFLSSPTVENPLNLQHDLYKKGENVLLERLKQLPAFNPGISNLENLNSYKVPEPDKPIFLNCSGLGTYHILKNNLESQRNAQYSSTSLFGTENVINIFNYDTPIWNIITKAKKLRWYSKSNLENLEKKGIWNYFFAGSEYLIGLVSFIVQLCHTGNPVCIFGHSYGGLLTTVLYKIFKNTENNSEQFDNLYFRTFGTIYAAKPPTHQVILSNYMIEGDVVWTKLLKGVAEKDWFEWADPPNSIDITEGPSWAMNLFGNKREWEIHMSYYPIIYQVVGEDKEYIYQHKNNMPGATPAPPAPRTPVPVVMNDLGGNNSSSIQKYIKEETPFIFLISPGKAKQIVKIVKELDGGLLVKVISAPFSQEGIELNVSFDQLTPIEGERVISRNIMDTGGNGRVGIVKSYNAIGKYCVVDQQNMWLEHSPKNIVPYTEPKKANAGWLHNCFEQANRQPFPTKEVWWTRLPNQETYNLWYRDTKIFWAPTKINWGQDGHRIIILNKIVLDNFVQNKKDEDNKFSRAQSKKVRAEEQARADAARQRAETERAEAQARADAARQRAETEQRKQTKKQKKEIKRAEKERQRAEKERQRAEAQAERQRAEAQAQADAESRGRGRERAEAHAWIDRAVERAEKKEPFTPDQIGIKQVVWSNLPDKKIYVLEYNNIEFPYEPKNIQVGPYGGKIIRLNKIVLDNLASSAS